MSLKIRAVNLTVDIHECVHVKDAGGREVFEHFGAHLEAGCSL